MKEETTTLLKLLTQKQALFESFEEFTKKAVCGDVEVMGSCLEDRSALICEIDAVDKKIREIIKGFYSDIDIIEGALKNTCNHSDIPAEYRQIFDKAQAIYTIIYRIGEVNKELLQKMGTLKRDIQASLKKINQNPKIAKFLQPMQGDGVLDVRG